MEIKSKITLEIHEFLKQYPLFKYRGKPLWNAQNMSDLNKQIWKNLSQARSMQTTELGYYLVRYGLERPCWDFELEEISGYDILKLDRYMQTPFYLDSKKRMLCIFDDAVAAQLMIYGNDVRSFLDAQDGVSDRPVKNKIPNKS